VRIPEGGHHHGGFIQSFQSMAKAASRRRETLKARIASAKESLATMEKELGTLDRILEALSGTDLKTASSRGGRRKGGKWRRGKPGRPPQWYLDQQKAKGKAKAAKKAPRKKRTVSAKVLAGLAKAREALAKKRAAAAQAAAP
jgi:hypothetical protein